MPGRRLVDPNVWNSIRELLKEDAGGDATIVYFHVWTGPHSTLIGLGRLPLSYVAEDFGWGVERPAAAIEMLGRHNLLVYDPGAKVFWLPAVLRTQPLQNERQVIAAERVIEGIPDTPLLTLLYEELAPQGSDRPYLKPLLERLRKRLSIQGNGAGAPAPAPAPTPSPVPNRFGEPSGKPSDKRSTRWTPPGRDKPMTPELAEPHRQEIRKTLGLRN